MSPNASASPAWARSTSDHTAAAASDGSGRLGYPVGGSLEPLPVPPVGASATSTAEPAVVGPGTVSCSGEVRPCGALVRPSTGPALEPGTPRAPGASLVCGRCRVRGRP